MRRAANWRLVSANLSKCSNCGHAMASHHVCPGCGFYNGELMVPRKVKKKEEEPPQQ